VVPERHQGGEESADDPRVDEVYLFPYGVGDPVGSWGRGRGALGEGESDFLFGEGVSGGDPCQAAPAGQGVFGGEEVAQKRTVDCNGVRGIREGGEPRGLSRGDQLFGGPDIVRGGFCKEIGPVAGLGSFYGFEVAELRLPCYGVGVWGSKLLGPTGSFGEFFPEGGEEGGPPSLRLRGGA